MKRFFTMLRRWRWRANKLIRLERTQLWELFQAQWYLVRAQIKVWRHPVGRLLSAPPAVSVGAVPDSALAKARRMDLALSRASEHGLFRPKCLVRAIAMQRFMERHGVRGARICIGVRKEAGDFLAHAWVEYGGMILTDRQEHVVTFMPLPGVHVDAFQAMAR